MSEHTAEATTLTPGGDPPRRTWNVQEVMYLDQPRSPEESRAMALAELRRTIRAEGYVIEEATLGAAEPVPIVVNAERTGYDVAAPGQEANALLTTWSAGATERLTDPEDALLSPIDQAVVDDSGRRVLIFAVPERISEIGGGVRLQHGLGGPVTVRATKSDTTPIGYLMAVEIDENSEHVEVVPGTARLVVIEDLDDPPAAEDTEDTAAAG